MSNRTPAERFWSYVDKSGECWEWTGYKTGGYGRFWVEGRRVTAHRFAYELFNAPIPDDSLVVDHRCHNRACVNPFHLRLATSKQNQEHRTGPNRNSTSGVRGVVWSRRKQKWNAQTNHNGSYVFVGYFDDIQEAEAAVIAKRRELFTHNDNDYV